MYEPSPDDTALHPLPRRRSLHASETRADVRARLRRYFFGASAAVAAAMALGFVVLPSGVQGERLHWIVGLHGALALASLLAGRLRPGRGTEAAMFGVLVLALAVVGATALLLGTGIAAPTVGYAGLLVCIVCAAAGRGWGVALALVAAAVVVALALLAPLPHNNTLQLLALLLLVGVGLLGGLLLSYVLDAYVRSADDREQRFRGLLAIAADAYWEIDARYRIVTAMNQREEPRELTPARGLGRVPWELPHFGCDPETLDALLADLDSRVAFHDRLVHWRRDSGEERLFMVSGEPRFDERGVFTGYWGVARDVSAEVAARQALAATETRYQELFARIPTPLVLHRDGRVIDANAAGVALFGHDSLDAMTGRDLLASYESGDSRERARRRLDSLAEADPGASLPMADFRLRLADGRRMAVRGTGMRVAADGGDATLSIYIDDTERHAAEEAVRRSETMLAHLVATSPDVITLTDLASGRYAMVNDTFVRVTGYSLAEVVGRTSLELGVWRHASDRDRFVETLRRDGSVSDLPTEFIAKGGQVVPMLVSGARFEMDRRDYLVINARDMTESERSRLEREAILQNAPIGIAVTLAQRFVLANPRFEQMFGWTPGSLPGQPGAVVWTDEAAYAAFGAAFAAALARGEQIEIEIDATRRDGSAFVARVRAKAIELALPHGAGRTLWIVEDVTERRRAERALADARDAAEAANRAKSAFLANTSHELRTPLNGMLHLAQLARDPALDAVLRSRYLEQIADGARSLAHIVSDILDLSRVEAGRLEFVSAPFDLRALLDTVQGAHAPLAAARGLTLALDIGDGLAEPVSGDALRVRQVLGNFVGNALKFTDAGGVRVVARRLPDAVEAGGRVRLEVHDTGPGIAPGVLERLFMPFTQADDSTTRRHGGTGLGLSICRQLARLMGGDVGAHSTLGHGSVFWAELPLPRSGAAAAAPTPAAAAVSDDLDADTALRGSRALMVEDNAVNMLIAVALLERWGVQVEQAHDGRQALDALQRADAAGTPFDIVLMDVQMPVMSGYDATRALRRLPGGARVPVVALTAAALATERDAAMDAGMDDFLTKPIDALKLRDTLLRWVQRGRDAAPG